MPLDVSHVVPGGGGTLSNPGQTRGEARGRRPGDCRFKGGHWKTDTPILGGGGGAGAWRPGYQRGGPGGLDTQHVSCQKYVLGIP